MRNKNSYMMLPVVIIFGFAILFLFIVMMNARSVASSRAILHDKLSGTTEDCILSAEEAVNSYVKEKCVTIMDEAKRKVDREVAESGKKVKDEEIEKLYSEAYEAEVIRCFQDNIKITLRDMNAVLPVLERGSVYISNDMLPSLELEHDEEGRFIGGIVEDIKLDYMYKGDLISDAIMSVEIPN